MSQQSSIAFPAKTTEQRGAWRDHLHDFSVCDRGPIILEVGNTSILLYNLLGPKVGKLVKSKNPLPQPHPWGYAHHFHNVTSKHPSKNSQYVSSLSVKRFEKLKNFQIARQKKKIREKCFFWRYSFNFNNLRSGGGPNATHQIWKRSTKRFWRRSFFYHFQQNAPCGPPGRGSAPILTTYSLLVAPMSHTKFQLNPPSGSGEKVENANV